MNIKVFSGNGKINLWVLTGVQLDSIDAMQLLFNRVVGHKEGGGPFLIDSTIPYVINYDKSKPASINIPSASDVGLRFFDTSK